MGCILWGCAVSGPKFIDIRYPGTDEAVLSETMAPGKIQPGKIGIALFEDRRKDMDEGYVGYRLLLDKSQETYFVQGMDLADTLTKIVHTYSSQKEWSPSFISPWDLTPEGTTAAVKGYQRILSGTINQFECRANKKAGRTDMILDIDLTFYLGSSDKPGLSVIPTTLTLERTELTFTREKLENFVNQALEEVIQKALAF